MGIKLTQLHATVNAIYLHPIIIITLLGHKKQTKYNLPFEKSDILHKLKIGMI